MSVGELLTALEELARQDDPFANYPIVYPESEA